MFVLISSHTVRSSSERKRKRVAADSTTSLTRGNGTSTKRRTEASTTGNDASLRIRYQNGQCEDIPLPADQLNTPLTEPQRAVS